MTEQIRMCTDRMLPLHRMVRSAQRSVQENPRNAPLLAPSQRRGQLRRMRMAVEDPHLWRDRRTLRVRFLGGDARVKTKVERYAHEWSAHCGITFAFGDDPQAEIRIAFADEGSWSWVGNQALEITDPNEATMNFGWLTPTTDDLEYSRVVLHEFGHALSCIHEHESPAAAIPWDKEAVYREYAKSPNRWSREEVDVNLFGRYAVSDTNFTAFDRQSIMLYAIDNALTKGDWEVGWNNVLSETDKQFIGAQYKKLAAPTVSLHPGAAPTGAAIGTHGEEDVFDIVISRPGTYVLETIGKTDVVLSLLGPGDRAAVMAFDDDSGESWNARIQADLEPGRYWARVKHYRPRATGDYRIVLKAKPA